jgi:hypothetical protein
LSRSSEIGTGVFGMSVVRKAVNSFSFSGVLSGQRELVTVMSRIVAVPLSRSVSTLPVNQNTPNTGSLLPFGIIDTAARASSTLSVNFSGCGW